MPLGSVARKDSSAFTLGDQPAVLERRTRGTFGGVPRHLCRRPVLLEQGNPKSSCGLRHAALGYDRCIPNDRRLDIACLWEPIARFAP